ncbi:unnamed protein product [Calypogeia fissa]
MAVALEITKNNKEHVQAMYKQSQEVVAMCELEEKLDALGTRDPNRESWNLEMENQVRTPYQLMGTMNEAARLIFKQIIDLEAKLEEAKQEAENLEQLNREQDEEIITLKLQLDTRKWWKSHINTVMGDKSEGK